MHSIEFTSEKFNVVRFHPVIGHEGRQGEQRYSCTLFLTSALEGVRGQCHAPAAPYPRERPGTHCAGGWVGLRAGLDRCGKSRSQRDSIPGPSSPQAVAIPTPLPGPQIQRIRKQYLTDRHNICTSIKYNNNNNNNNNNNSVYFRLPVHGLSLLRIIRSRS